MTTVFPTNNLPTASQPWAREVQKQLSNLISSYDSERINNTARDNQLNSSIISLGGVVTQVTNALEEIGLLQDTVLVDGEPTKIDGANIKVGTLSASQITTGTLNANLVTVSNINASNITSGTINASTVAVTNINASNITAGTLTGVTVQTGSSGTRVVLSGSKANFYFGSSYVGDIIGDNTWSGLNSLAVRNATGTHGFYTDATSAGLESPTCFIGVGTAATVAGNGVTADFGGLSFGTLQISGNILASGSYSVIGVTQAIIGPGGGVYPTNGTQTGTANVIQDASSAILRRVSSARKYKLDIQDVDYGLKALNLRPRTWIDKTLYEENGNSADGLVRIPGFVAEEVFEAGLEELVKFNENGEVESLHYDRMIGALIPVLKYQQNVISELINRIETLEKGA